jgi:hypothetical protein
MVTVNGKVATKYVNVLGLQIPDTDVEMIAMMRLAEKQSLQTMGTAVPTPIDYSTSSVTAPAGAKAAAASLNTAAAAKRSPPSKSAR